MKEELITILIIIEKIALVELKYRSPLKNQFFKCSVIKNVENRWFKKILASRPAYLDYNCAE